MAVALMSREEAVRERERIMDRMSDTAQQRLHRIRQRRPDGLVAHRRQRTTQRFPTTLLS